MNLHLVTGSANPVYTYLFLQSLRKYTSIPYSLHLILEDNNPTKEDDVPLGAMCQELTVTRLGKGFHGVGAAWNRGLDLAEERGADYTGILNDDIFFVEDWGARLVGYIEKRPEAGAVSPHWYWTGAPPIEGLNPQEAWKVAEPWVAGSSSTARTYNAANSEVVERGLVGSFFFLNMKMLREMKQFEVGLENIPGRFDSETFKLNWEDVDASFRIDRMGYSMLVTHSVSLLHHGSQTVARADVKEQLGDGYKEGLPKFLKKWKLEHLAGKPFMVSNSLFIVDGQTYPR